MRRWIPRLLIGLCASAALALAMPASPAGAYNAGVKSLHVVGDEDMCLEGQALPCTPGAGSGHSNEIRVVQNEVAGYQRFSSFETTSQFDDHVWMAVEIGAECRVSHRLFLASVGGPHDELMDKDALNAGQKADTFDVGFPGPGLPHWVGVPEAKEMPKKTIAVHVPFQQLLDDGMISEFADLESVYDYGEQVVAQRRLDGWTPAEARGTPFERTVQVELGAEVWCRHRVIKGSAFVKQKNFTVGVKVKFMPTELDPAVSELPNPDGLLLPTVTDVNLMVAEDADEQCTLHLSGVIETNIPTTVTYRFRDPYGQLSKHTYQVDVDQTLVAMVSHSADIPFAPAEPDGDDFAPNQDGEIGGYAGDVPAGTYSGVYELEVISPGIDSDTGGFAVPYCQPIFLPVDPDSTG